MTNDQLLSKINSSSFTFAKLTEIAEMLDAMKGIVINGRQEDIDAAEALQADIQNRDLRIVELETQIADVTTILTSNSDATTQTLAIRGVLGLPTADASDVPPTDPLVAEQPKG